MSGTQGGTQGSSSGPVVYTPWLVDIMNELEVRETGDNFMGRAKAAAPVVQPNRPRLPPPPAGKGLSKVPGAGLMRSLLMGADRRNIDPENQAKIEAMHEDGQAAAVELAGQNGRRLKGNFFSAEGHNLKGSQGAPDLSRPAVLLLTGSGGSAQDQGLEVAQNYAKEGASVLSVNFGGFGDSAAPNNGDKRPTEESLYQDAHTMLQHLVDLGYDPENIIIHGYSLGNAIGGKLKEEMEAGSMTPANGAAGTPVKFRGQVVDRPMLSLSHGVEAQGFGKPAGTVARKVLGTFSARRAVADSANDDTRMVITNDTDMGPQVAEFRQRLQGQRNTLPVGSSPAKTVVSGAASGSGHMDHAAMLTANAAELRSLINTKRDGAAQVVASGKTHAMSATSELRTRLDENTGQVEAGATQAEELIKNHAAGNAVERNKVRAALDLANARLGQALDITRNCPPRHRSNYEARCKAAVGRLKAAIPRLLGILNALPAPPVAPGAVAPPPPRVNPALIEVLEADADGALRALEAAGGSSAANRELENAVVEAWKTIDALNGDDVFDDALVEALGDARDEIRERYEALRRQAAAKRKKRRGMRPGTGTQA